MPTASRFSARCHRPGAPHGLLPPLASALPVQLPAWVIVVLAAAAVAIGVVFYFGRGRGDA